MNVNPFSYLIEKLKSKVSKSGDTMTGNLIISRNATTSELELGNSTTSKGLIILFSNNDKYEVLRSPDGMTANRNIYLPDASGTVALDKGSVSVTADGVKSYKQLLNELKSLIDFSKVGVTTKLSLDTTYFTISYNGGANAIFSQVDISSQLPSIVRMNISSDSSLTTYQNNSYADISNSVLSSGKKIVLYY